MGWKKKVNLNDLFLAYITDARFFSSMHALLAATVLFLWLFESYRMASTRSWITTIAASGPSRHSQLATVSAYLRKAADKGQLPTDEDIERKLKSLINPYEQMYSFCINGFILVGLLGTLYNFWLLGPPFWQQLIREPSSSTTVPLNLAFTASIFGLAWAVLTSGIDAFLMEPQRFRSIQVAKLAFLEDAVERMPPSGGAALISAHREIAEKLRQHVEAVTAVHGESMRGLVQEWADLMNEALRDFNEGSKFVVREARELGDMITMAKAAVALLAPKIEALGDLSDHLGNLRRDISEMTSSVKTEVKRTVDSIFNVIEGLVQQQDLAVRDQLELARGRLTDLMDKWHAEASKQLQRYAKDLEDAVKPVAAGWQGIAEQARDSLEESRKRVSLVTSIEGTLARMVTTLETLDERLNEAERTFAGVRKTIEAGVGPPQSDDGSLRDAIRDLTTMIKAFTERADLAPHGETSKPSANSELAVAFRGISSTLDVIAKEIRFLADFARKNGGGHTGEIDGRESKETTRQKLIRRFRLKI